MLSLDSLEVTKKSNSRPRKPLCRTRTLDGSYPSSFGRLDKDSSSNDASENNQQQQAPPRRKVKKSVKFVDEADWSCHEFDPIVTEESQLAEFWVLPEELKEIKKQGFLACKEAKRTGLAGLLTEIYGAGSERGSAHNHHHTERDAQDRLNYWCRMASACRGLERFANEELSKRRTIFRKRAIVSVLEAQQQLKNEKGIDTANVLRRLSEAYTEQSRVYALKLGTADFHAIQTIKAPPPPPPPPSSPRSAAAAAAAKPQDGRKSRKSRTERMKDRAAATEQRQNQQGENGVGFRRNNTTMSAVVLQTQ